MFLGLTTYISCVAIALMRVVTTFNDPIYEFSGRSLIESVRTYLPTAELFVYYETSGAMPDMPGQSISDLHELRQVFLANKDIIPLQMGGEAIIGTQLHRYAIRWFGWFRKIVTLFYASNIHTYDGFTIFCDADVRVVAPFLDQDIADSLLKPVGVFRGDLPALESGIIMFSGNSEDAKDFFRHALELYTAGEFRRFDRWDDGAVLGRVMDEYPAVVHDFARGQTAAAHTNSNGHSTTAQLVFQTVWGNRLEHDKGIHWRAGIVPATNK